MGGGGGSTATMVLGLSPQSSKWVLVYFPVSWLTQVRARTQAPSPSPVRPRPGHHCGRPHPALPSQVGPAQLGDIRILPVFARNTGVDIATINLVWTFGFFGYMVGSLATSWMFASRFRSDGSKLAFLATTIAITGVSC